jgi:hypothetical protein
VVSLGLVCGDSHLFVPFLLLQQQLYGALEANTWRQRPGRLPWQKQLMIPWQWSIFRYDISRQKKYPHSKHDNALLLYQNCDNLN